MLKSAAYRLLRPLVSVKDVDVRLKRVRKADLAKLNRQMLRDILEFASKNNAYYRPLLAEGAELGRLPILTKAIVRERYEDLKSSGVTARTYENSSGGSTGKAQTFLQDMDYSSWSEVATEYYYREFLGVDPATVRKVVLWGSERDIFKEKDIKGQLANWMTNTLFLNSFKVEEKDWIDYVRRISRYKPHFIRGYAGSLYQLAKVIKQHRLTVHRPKFLYSSAEWLQDFMRAEIEEAFGAKVYDYYGSREVGAIAGECAHGNRHIFSFHNHVEIVDLLEDKPTDGAGRILITNLHNYSMPLLRYDIGDVGRLGVGVCPCGSKLPWLAELRGRVTDHFHTKQGTVVHGEYFTHLFYFRDWAEEFQVNQVDYDRIEILVAGPDEPDGKDVAEIDAKIRLVMGDDCRIEWKQVEAIPKTPQGKHLFTRSLVTKK